MHDEYEIYLEVSFKYVHAWGTIQVYNVWKTVDM